MGHGEVNSYTFTFKKLNVGQRDITASSAFAWDAVNQSLITDTTYIPQVP